MSEKNKKQEQEKESNEVPVDKSAKKGRKKSAAKKKSKDDEKLQELNDKYLRLFSEFDNFRKRTQKEKLELFKTASEDVMIAMLPVLDDFERAMKASGENGVDKSYLEGVELI